MSPGNNEDRLPFSNAADVYAFGWELYLTSENSPQIVLLDLLPYLLPFSTIWYELQARDWPITSQPVEATIWQVGSGEGIRRVLAEINLGKEVTVSAILSLLLDTCSVEWLWNYATSLHFPCQESNPDRLGENQLMWQLDHIGLLEITEI